MHPYSRASMVSAFSNRALSLNGALGLSKSSVENFLKHRQASLVRQLISRVRSTSSVMRPPKGIRTGGRGCTSGRLLRSPAPVEVVLVSPPAVSSYSFI